MGRKRKASNTPKDLITDTISEEEFEEFSCDFDEEILEEEPKPEPNKEEPKPREEPKKVKGLSDDVPNKFLKFQN